eukprot:Seg3801.4 transcript_id=Seg3801.4/GoldUCD/mRNA.D3Y31 product="tRNA wybutosine-synthesizing protein 4" protein_id=Seg3801.4/GoldUCD/D3Y31
MPKSKGNDLTVQGTNDSSIVSKCSMASLGYFKDNFLQHFVKKKARRAPLINRGYYVRAAAMDFAVKIFIKNNQHVDKQIISLGAGFDSCYFRLRDQGILCNTRFLEIDFPELVRRKTKLIQANETLSNLIGDIKHFENEISTKNYSLIGCDLTNLKQLEDRIQSLHFSKEIPTLLMSEVVLTYVDKESCSKLIQWTASMFANSVFLLYEQIQPNDAFGLVMQKHFNKLQTPLKCIDSYPTKRSQIERFISMGWSDADAMDMNEFYYNVISEEERNRIDCIEPFDEFEEWHLKCMHYNLAVAFNGECCQLRNEIFPGIQKDREVMGNVTAALPWKCTSEESEAFQRFGHQLARVDRDLVVLSGGFGCSDNRHSRLKDAVVINIAPGDF